jgi:hypothetical protein
LAPGGTLLLKDFDPSMQARSEGFASFHFPSLDELLSAFGGLEIVRAEVVETPAHHHEDHSGADSSQDSSRPGDPWTAMLIQARRPD